MLIKVARGPVPPLVLIAGAVTIWYACQHAPQSSKAPDSTAHGVYFVSPSERTGADTLADWTSKADVVVRATVTGEERIEPVMSETTTGEGTQLVGRTVTLTTAEVMWRSPVATNAKPSDFAMSAFGWMRTEDGIEHEVAAEGQTRMEVGHQYIIALEWREPECGAGDERVPARWSAIGSGGILPADGDTIGVGEFEGSPTELSTLEETPSATVGSLLARYAGKSPAELAHALELAPTDQSHSDVRNTGTCSD